MTVVFPATQDFARMTDLFTRNVLTYDAYCAFVARLLSLDRRSFEGPDPRAPPPGRPKKARPKIEEAEAEEEEEEESDGEERKRRREGDSELPDVGGEKDEGRRKEYPRRGKRPPLVH